MTSARSVLDNSLAQLTEDEISQLTREDCRKFLMDKGMRRPSWNKSQAIHQVISLKALLEGGDDDDSGARATLRKIDVSAVAAAEENPPRANSNPWTAAEEIVPRRRQDPTERAHPCVISSSPKGADMRISSPSYGTAEDVAGQMMIFYCGQGNVYDGVSLDKAQSIMQFAAGPVPLFSHDLASGTNPVLSFHRREQIANDQLGPSSLVTAAASHPTLADVEGHLNRKILLQRYLEKRKDRGRFKVRKDVGQISSNLDMYLSHQVRTSICNGQLRMSKQ